MSVSSTQAFSILERIEWAATQAGQQQTAAASASFSILERIEWAATQEAFHEALDTKPFSILERIEWAATTHSTTLSTR